MDFVDLNQLYTFYKVCEHESLATYAEVSGTPTSTLRTRISKLEKHMGRKLMFWRRSINCFELTEEGVNLYRSSQLLFEHFYPSMIEGNRAK